ncbi:MAG TPA: conjugal transfer protein TraI [Chitinophagaceae bacterium]|nr:conjugal transfer protein TraI [Chitinophagaceae bacterium]
MKKLIIVLALFFSMKSQAQFPIAEIIKAGIKKVIVAVDLKIQKLQNKTIWLQNAQKTLENVLSKTKLTEISGWVEKQRKLYDDYFQELKKIKNALSYYHRIKDIIEDQVAMVKEYKAAWALFRQDRNFTAAELEYMSEVYTGMLGESVKSIDQLLMVVNAFTTQMTDAARMEIINTTAAEMEKGFMDLKEFNNQNKLISLQRASTRGEIEYIKKLYGL